MSKQKKSPLLSKLDVGPAPRPPDAPLPFEVRGEWETLTHLIFELRETRKRIAFPKETTDAEDDSRDRAVSPEADQ